MDLNKVRKQIETVFSQLSDQFMIQRNYAKFINGLKIQNTGKGCRIYHLQFLKQFMLKQPVGKVKHALAN